MKQTMTNIKKETKQYHYTSDFGLYRYHHYDNYTFQENRNKFGCALVLLTAAVVLSLTCAILYIYKFKSILVQPIFKLNNTEIELQNNTDENGLDVLQFKKENHHDSEDIPYQAKFDSQSSEREIIQLRRLQFMALSKKNTDIKEPRPFLYEIRDPKPSAFKPSIASNHKHAEDETPINKNNVRNIQDIIKYLTDQRQLSEFSNSYVDNSKPIRISGTYKQPDVQIHKKNNNLNNHNMKKHITDPFFPYKPQNPSDVNLLAVDNFRFAPSVQLEPRKPLVSDETSTSFENGKLNQIKTQTHNNGMAVTFNVMPTRNSFEENIKYKRNNQNFHPYLYGPYTSNIYRNQSFYNQMGRYHYDPYLQHRQNYFKKHNNLEPATKQPSKMIIHLNLYPKNKSKGDYTKTVSTGIEIDDSSKQYSNCTLDHEEKISQISNAAEFNEMLQNIRHYSAEQTKPSEDRCPNNVPTYGPIRPDQDNQISTKIPEDVEIVKSIGFTILHPSLTQEKLVYAYSKGFPQTRPNGEQPNRAREFM